MSDVTEAKSINFLRGVPSDEVLERLIPIASEGYEKAIKRYGTDVLQYGHFNGFEPLRNIIGEIHYTNPGRVIVGNGGMEVISLFLKSLPKNSNIIIEETTYDRVVLDAEIYGHNLIGVELTPAGVNLDQLREMINKYSVAAFYGIPFHQNPTGINYSEENLKAVEQICKDKGIICAWDICYESLRYDGKKNIPIRVSGWGPVLINSFTKTISPGTKCGYIVLPVNFVDQMMRVVANTRINPNLPTQAFISDFMESGEYEKFLDYICRLYKPRMDALNEALNTHFPGAFATDMSGGFFTCLTLMKITTEQERSFINAAKEAGIGIAAAWDTVAPNCRDLKRQKGLFMRLTFPAFEPDKITWGISTLKKIEVAFQ